MNLCKDCKYFSHPLDTFGKTEPYCLHESAQTYDDPVWGNHSKQTCKTMRNDGTLCGVMGTRWIAAAEFTPVKYKEL